MHVIAGLGNPGRSYKDTRHNAGFMALDALSQKTGIKIWGMRFRARTGSGKARGRKLFLLKPRTFMNLSGESVAASLRGLSKTPSDLIVMHDDLDLPAGGIRVKRKGGAGGHKGVGSIIESLGTDEFARVRIGIGKPGPGDDPVEYVLSPFDYEQLPLIIEAVDKGAAAALAVVTRGVDAAMNEFN